MSSGYDFVPLPDAVSRQTRDNNRHDLRLKNFLQVLIEARYVTVEPIHIGAGSRALQDGNVVRESVRILGRPGIPGSSMRGLLRARFEAITKSCSISDCPRPTRLGPNLPSSTFPAYDVRFAKSVAMHPVFERCQKPVLCLSCALFGLMQQRSRLSVHDVETAAGTTFCREPMPQLFGPRPHHLGTFSVDDHQRCLTVNALHGRKFHCNGGPTGPGRSELVEVIPQGTELRAKMSVVNASPVELGALLAALGRDPVSVLKVGAGKAHGFGRLEAMRQPAHFSVRIQSPTASTLATAEEISDWRAAFTQSSDYWQTGEQALSALRP